MKLRTILISLALLSIACISTLGLSDESSENDYTKRWGPEIHAFREWDAKNSFPDNAVLFVGSSSIRMWETARFFPELKVINRGFGGSDIKAVNYFFDKIVSCYKPSKIVFYAGDNDIAGGLAPEALCEDFKTFCKLCSEKIPAADIIYISIKCSGLRFNLWPQMNKANSLIESFCRTKPNLQYIDLATCLLDDSGIPDHDLFLKDRLHLSEAGYRLWTNRLKPLLLNPANPVGWGASRRDCFPIRARLSASPFSHLCR